MVSAQPYFKELSHTWTHYKFARFKSSDLTYLTRKRLQLNSSDNFLLLETRNPTHECPLIQDLCNIGTGLTAYSTRNGAKRLRRRLVSTPVCASKVRSGPVSPDQGHSTSNQAATICTAYLEYAHPPPPIPPLWLAQSPNRLHQCIMCDQTQATPNGIISG